jgi:acyl-CoA synthetase (AMP-forming)/AMP-acid ligase II
VAAIANETGNPEVGRHSGQSPKAGAGTAEIEAWLQSCPGIIDFAVVSRATGEDGHGVTAYVVPAGNASSEGLRAGLLSQGELVLVSAIPRCSDGEIDTAALARCQAMGIGNCGPTQAGEQGIAMRRTSVPLGALHLWDVLPDRRGLVSEPSVTLRAAAMKSVESQLTRISIVHGRALRQSGESLATLPDTLRNAALRHSAQGLVYLDASGQERVQSYAELLQEASCIATGLRNARLSTGDCAILQMERNCDFIPALWGCLLAGIVPVPMNAAPFVQGEANAVSRFRMAWEMLHRPPVLTGGNAAKNGASHPGLAGIRTIPVDELRQGPLSEQRAGFSADQVALIMLTSGSTGTPKAVPLTHANLIARSSGSRQMHDFGANEVSFNWMPLDHVAGIVYFHLRDVFLGAKQVHAATEAVLQNPLSWLDGLHRLRATITFAPNFGFALVNDCAEAIRRASWDLSCVRRVLNGAEAVVPRTARRFMALLTPFGLPATAMRPVWGMSETSSGVLYSDRFLVATTNDSDVTVPVGEPIPGVSLRVVDSSAQVVPEGVPGRLQVTGTTVMKGYLERPDLNAKAFTADGWFDTGDTAMIEDGQVTITGREKDDIVINSVKYAAQEIEAVVDDLDVAVTSYSAACAIRLPGAETDELAVFFAPAHAWEENLPSAIGTIRAAIAKQVGPPPSFVLPVNPTEIPKTSLGKIQRASLRQRLEQGGFDENIKRVDVLSRNARTVPDWFYRPVWRRSNTRMDAPPENSPVVVFFRDSAQQSTLETAFQNRNAIAVVPGSGFERPVQPGFAYRVRPGNADDCRCVFEDLLRGGWPGRHVLFLNNCGAVPENPTKPALDLLAVVQGLAGARESTPDSSARFTILTVSTGSRQVFAGERVDAAKAAARLLLNSAQAEFAWLECRAIDLVVQAPDLAAVLDAEIRARRGEADVAYRSKQRWACRLERTPMRPRSANALPFERGGLWILSGGLGGVAREIAALLLRDFGVRLLLVGRAHLDHSGDKGPEMLRVLEELTDLGEVRYAALDICDAEALGQAVEEARHVWGCDTVGAIHLAGSYRERLVTEETAITFNDAVRAKVEGALALVSVLSRYRGACFIGSSSVNGWFGGLGTSAYAVANAYLDALAEDLNAEGAIRANSIAWSMWDDVGMSRGSATKERSRARGFVPISPRLGANSFLAAVACTHGHVLVGLDGGNPAISAYLNECRPLEEAVEDSCSSIGQEPPAAVRVSPRNQLENTIARVWSLVLAVDELDVFTNFFDLGGSSLLMAEAFRRLRKEIDVELSLSDLFAHPTISALAGRLAGESKASLDTEVARGAERRDRMQRLRGRKPVA